MDTLEIVLMREQSQSSRHFMFSCALTEALFNNMQPITNSWRTALSYSACDNCYVTLCTTWCAMTQGVHSIHWSFKRHFKPQE